MFKRTARNLTFVTTLLAVVPAALASPTGGDPEPMSTGIVQVILALLHLA